MDYCSVLLAGTPTLHLAIHAVESMALRIIGISCDEAGCLGLLLSHRRQVGDLSVCHHLVFRLAPSALLDFCRIHIVCQ